MTGSRAIKFAGCALATLVLSAPIASAPAVKPDAQVNPPPAR